MAATQMVVRTAPAYESFMMSGVAMIMRDPMMSISWISFHRVEETWKSLAIRDSNSPKLWMDASLAAFAMSAGCQMITTDKAFSQFKGFDLMVVKAQ